MFLSKSTLIESTFGLRRQLKISPMCRIVREIQHHDIDLSELDALEMFAYTGKLQTMDYASLVSSLEAWEINPNNEEALKRNLPYAKIKIVDSYKEIKETKNKFNLIVIDSPGSLEHFDVLPHLKRITKLPATIILNVIPKMQKGIEDDSEYTSHLERRHAFYKTNNPENIELESMLKIYEDRFQKMGFKINWHIFKKKWNIYWYLVLNIGDTGLAS